MDVFKEERCFANLALELFRNYFQFWKVSLNFYKIGLSLFVEKPFIFIHMKAKKLELKKEVIATLNKSKMSGLWGGLEGVTIDTCASAGNLLCNTLRCLVSRDIDCGTEDQASVCNPCLPKTESHCQTMQENCTSMNIRCKLTDFC